MFADISLSEFFKTLNYQNWYRPQQITVGQALVASMLFPSHQSFQKLQASQNQRHFYT